LLYNIVGRALGGHADVDDVVQETVLRLFRDLPDLRSPASFRPWLVSIAMHQISERMRFWQQQKGRSGALSEAAEMADPSADFADLTILRLSLSGQRRQVAEAVSWLDPGDRELLSLWWMEIAGEIDRADIAAALEISAAHARVRLQRMRRQLELSRNLVAALHSPPRCPGLDAVAGGWDGRPSPRWRKRFARHLRECDVCAAVRPGFVPIERLLAGISLVPVPASLAASIAGGTLAGGAVTGAAAGPGATLAAGAAGWFGQLAGMKVAAAVVAASTAAGGWYLALPEGSSPDQVAAAPPATGVTSAPERPGVPVGRPSPSAVARPTARFSTATPAPSSTGLVPLGAVVIRPVNDPGRSLAQRDGKVLLVPAASAGTEDTTFALVPGLADATCYSLRLADGRYIRHSSFRLVLATDSDPLFRVDATYCARPGAGGVRLQSFNYRDRYVRHRGDDIWLDPGESNADFLAESSFLVSPRR
jgi:RNA polymerase sigma factor (sigma-70 family)